MLQPSCIDDDDDPPSHNVGGPTPDGESTESVAASTNNTLPATVVVHQQQRTTADDDSSSSGAVDMVCGSQASAAVTAAETAGEATGQHYCLRWNNYQSNMTSVFHHLLRTQAFVDVTLACDDQSLKAHKVVLSACSSYFQKLLLENPCKHPTIIMPQDVCYADLKFIIEFVYKGEIDVSQTQLQSLLKTADQLKIKGLCEVPDGKSGAEVTPLILPASPPPSSHRLSGCLNGVSGGGRSDGVGMIGASSASGGVVVGGRRRRLSSSCAGGSGPGVGAKRRLYRDRPNHHLRDDGNSNEGIEGHPVDIAEEAGDGKDRLAPQLVVVDPQGRLAEAIVLTTASSAQSAAPHHHIQQPSQAQAHTTAAQSTSKSEHHDSSSRLATEEQLISVERQNGVVIDPLDAPTSEPPAPSATLVSTQIELPQPESTTRRDIAIDSSDLSIEENGGVKVKFETLRAMEHHHHMDMEAAARMSDEGDHHGMHTMMITPELLGLIPSSNSESSETDSKSHSNSSTMASSSMTPGVGGKTWSSEDMDAALEALRKQTMSLSKASALYGIPSTTLWQRAHRLGIDTPKKEGPTKSWTEDNLNTALDALRTGTLSANKASKAFGIPSSTLYKIARREGIRLAAPFNAAPTSWVPEDLERALESIRSGQYTVQRAATEYGIPSGTLYGRCKREGIELSRNNPTPWSEDAMMEALEAVRLGHMSINQAAIHYNLPYSSLYGRFKRVKFDPDGVPTGGMHGDSEGSTGDVITGPQPPQAQPAPSGQSQSQQQATTSAPSQQPSHQTTPQIMLVQYQQPLHMYQSAT